MPTEVSAIARQDIEAYIADLVDTRAANTAASAYRGLQRFFGWLAEEEEITSNPMERSRGQWPHLSGEPPGRLVLVPR
jgi:site-specific recombinase XerD